MDNREVAGMFESIGDLLEIQGESVFKVLAYRRAAESIRSLGRDLHEVWAQKQLRDIPGVGEAIAAKIDELFKTGHMAFYDRLTTEVPLSLTEVLRVGDVGPKKAARFWKELGITSRAQLEAAARAGRLRDLPGMGAKSEARILESIEALKQRQSDRISIGTAMPVAEDLLSRLRSSGAVAAAEMAGSMRRWRETVGDIDLLVGASRPEVVMRAFLALPEVKRVRGQGETKASVELANGLAVQMWVHPPERFGTALQYATGSQAHNVRLRELALGQGLSLSEHSFKRKDGSEILCSTEEQVYATLGLPWIPPELREDRGEIQAAQADNLPPLVSMKDIAGELHAHTDWSDGAATLDEMAQAAARVGLTYLVISDHSKSLGVANGLNAERLREQRKAIDRVQKKLGGRLRLLQGIEVEILADGELDFPDKVLKSLDVVTASVHSSLRQRREQVTARMLKAIRNPNVDVVGHPTGRMIGSRDAADLDMEAVFRAAADHGVALEINSHPERLDLNESHARRAAEIGCLLAINTDAHRPEHFDLRRYGVGTARRAWVHPDQVVNTWALEKLTAWVDGRR